MAVAFIMGLSAGVQAIAARRLGEGRRDQTASGLNAGLLIAELADRIECRVHRVCIGSGIELPAFCQRIVATKETIFQLPEITMGMIPGAGGTVSVLQRIGRQRTAYFALSAKKIDAQTALEWGLIDAIDPDI